MLIVRANATSPTTQKVKVKKRRDLTTWQARLQPLPDSCLAIALPPSCHALKPTSAPTLASTLLSRLCIRSLALPRTHSFITACKLFAGCGHLTAIGTSRPSLPRSVTKHNISYQHPTSVHHELASEEGRALVRHPSRRERFCDSQCTLRVISAILPANAISLTRDHAG